MKGDEGGDQQGQVREQACPARFGSKPLEPLVWGLVICFHFFTFYFEPPSNTEKI